MNFKFGLAHCQVLRGKHRGTGGIRLNLFFLSVSLRNDCVVPEAVYRAVYVFNSNPSSVTADIVLFDEKSCLVTRWGNASSQAVTGV